MKCPFCNASDTKVVDTRASEDDKIVRRRRECISCHKRFTTYERVEKTELIVVKKDGTREIFDRDKILNGVVRASMKRPVSSKQINDLVSRVEDRARNQLSGEIPTETIGNWVMDELKELDDVAYVRFASVYRQFKDVTEFMNELKGFLGK